MNDALTLSPLIAWVGALSLLLNFGLSLWGILASGSRANTTRLNEHEARLGRHDTRLGGVEQTLRSVPSTSDLHKIEMSLAGMAGDLRVMGQRLEPVAAIADRLQELLLQQSQQAKR